MSGFRWRHDWQAKTASGIAPGGNGSARYEIYPDEDGYTVSFYRGKRFVTTLDEELTYLDAMRLAEDHHKWRTDE